MAQCVRCTYQSGRGNDPTGHPLIAAFVNFSRLLYSNAIHVAFDGSLAPKVVRIIESYNNSRAFFAIFRVFGGFFEISGANFGLCGSCSPTAEGCAVRRTAKFTCVSQSRGRNIFDKPSAEPNLFGFCRGEKTSAKRTFDCFKSAAGIRFSAVARPTPKSFHRGGF